VVKHYSFDASFLF